MRKNIFSNIVALVLAAAALMCFSCKQSLDLKGADTGAGRVKVGFALDLGRTALPDAESVLTDEGFVFVLTGGTAGEEQATLGTWNGKAALIAASLSLDAGTYDFTLTGTYKDLIYVGVLNNKTIEGSVALLRFELYCTGSAENTTETGSFKVDLAWDADSTVGKVLASLYSVDGETETSVADCTDMALTPADGADELEGYKVASVVKNDLPAGHYLLKYKLYADENATVLLDNTPEEDIYVGGELLSESLVKTVVPAAYTITYQLTGNGQTGTWKDGYTAPAMYSRFTRPELPVAANLNFIEDFHFDGWYEESDFSGDEVTTLNGLMKNMSLYARWMPDSTRVELSLIVSGVNEVAISAQQSGNIVTLTAEEGYTNYKWSVKAASDTTLTSDERIFTFDASDFAEDYYTVNLTAKKGGITWSTRASVFVDKDAPALVSNLIAERNGDKVTLSWTNPDDDDFSKVNIYWTDENGSHIEAVSGTKSSEASKEITVATSSETYTFNVKSVDVVGHESSARSITSKMVMKVVSDGNYDLSSAKRWNTSIGGFNVADVGKTFSFKLKFVNDGVYQFNGASGTIYVRTDQEKFIYWSSGTGSMSALSGEWAGWYEITGTITSSSNTTFAVVMNGDDVSGTNKFSNAALYIADFKFGTEGAMNTVNNSNLSVGRYDSNITPVKSFVTLENAN